MSSFLKFFNHYIVHSCHVRWDKIPPVEFMAILGMTMPPIHSQFSKGITCWVLLVWVPLLLSYYNLQNLPYIIISCFRSTRSVIAVKWFRWFALWRCAPSRTPPKHWLKSNAPWNPAAWQRHWRFSQSLFSYFDVSILLVEFVSQKSMGLYLFRLAGSGIWKSLVASWWILGLKWHPETFFQRVFGIQPGGSPLLSRWSLLISGTRPIWDQPTLCDSSKTGNAWACSSSRWWPESLL